MERGLGARPPATTYTRRSSPRNQEFWSGVGLSHRRKEGKSRYRVHYLEIGEVTIRTERNSSLSDTPGF